MQGYTKSLEERIPCCKEANSLQLMYTFQTKSLAGFLTDSDKNEYSGRDNMEA